MLQNDPHDALIILNVHKNSPCKGQKKIPAPAAPAVFPKISNWRKTTGSKFLGGLDSNRLPPPCAKGLTGGPHRGLTLRDLGY